MVSNPFFLNLKISLKKGIKFLALPILLFVGSAGTFSIVAISQERQNCIEKIEELEFEFDLNKDFCRLSFDKNGFYSQQKYDLEKYENEFLERQKEFQKSLSETHLILESANSLNLEITDLKEKTLLISNDENLKIETKTEKNQEIINQVDKLITDKVAIISEQETEFQKQILELEKLQRDIVEYSNFSRELRFLLSYTNSLNPAQSSRLNYLSTQIPVKQEAINQEIADARQELLIEQQKKQATTPTQSDLDQIQIVTEKQIQITDVVNCNISKCIALTFDDGPHPTNTPRLLEILKERNVPATFYVIGNLVESYPSLLKDTYNQKHEIGNHTVNHPNLKTIPIDKAQEEVNLTDAIIEKHLGIKPLTYRPPYGAISQELNTQLNKPAIMWDVDPKDWKDKDANLIARRVIFHTQNKSIILLHDIHATSVEAVPGIIDSLLSQGYTFVTVSKLLNVENGDLPVNIYNSGR